MYINILDFHFSAQSLSIFTQKYLRKCKDNNFILQIKYLRIYRDSFLAHSVTIQIHGRLSNLISSFILHFHTFKIGNSTPIIIWLYISYLLNISVENQKPLIEVRISELCDALSFKKWTCQSRDRRTWVYCFLKAFSCKNPFIKLCWSKATHCTMYVVHKEKWTLRKLKMTPF